MFKHFFDVLDLSKYRRELGSANQDVAFRNVIDIRRDDILALEDYKSSIKDEGHYQLDTINDQDLSNIVKLKLKTYDVDLKTGMLRSVPSLFLGGITAYSRRSDDYIIHAVCCEDLDQIDGWLKVAEKSKVRVDEWNFLFRGHGEENSVFYKVLRGFIIFGLADLEEIPTDANGLVLEVIDRKDFNPRIAIIMPAAEFRRQIYELAKEQEVFVDRVQKIITEIQENK